MEIGSVGCAADPAVLVAAEDGRTAVVAPAPENLAGAGTIGVVAVAAARVLGEASHEHVASPLERGELGPASGDDVVELS
jgi:hypothetical protein